MADIMPEVTILTPTTIPEYSRKTGRSEEGLMNEYRKAYSKNQILYGFYAPAPWWVDEIATE